MLLAVAEFNVAAGEVNAWATVTLLADRLDTYEVIRYDTTDDRDDVTLALHAVIVVPTVMLLAPRDCTFADVMSASGVLNDTIVLTLLAVSVCALRELIAATLLAVMSFAVNAVMVAAGVIKDKLADMLLAVSTFPTMFDVRSSSATTKPFVEMELSTVTLQKVALYDVTSVRVAAGTVMLLKLAF